MEALVIGGTGPTGPHILTGLLERDFDVTLLHRGVHEPPGLPEVPHLHADPHFPETLDEATDGRSFDVVLAMYGRVRAIADVFDGRCGQLVAVGGVPVVLGMRRPPGHPSLRDASARPRRTGHWPTAPSRCPSSPS